MGQEGSTSSVSEGRPVTVRFGHPTHYTVRRISGGKLTTTQYNPFSLMVIPEPGPPGPRSFERTVTCPTCGKELKLQCTQWSVVFTTPADFRSEEGKALKRALFSHLRLSGNTVGGMILWMLFVGLPVAFFLSNSFSLFAVPGSVASLLEWLLPIGVLFYTLIRGYQYMMLSRRDCLTNIEGARRYRPEFRCGFNVVVRVVLRGEVRPVAEQTGVPKRSVHFKVGDDTSKVPSRNLLKFAGLDGCHVF